MKKVYIVLISTDNKMGSLIKFTTRYKFNHVAISLDKDLKEMYSFARYREKNALVGGFIHEKPNRYINKPPHIKVFEIKLQDTDYNKLIKKLENIKSEFNKYIYNTYSAILFPLNRKVKIRKAMTCFEFVTYLLGDEDYHNIKELDQKMSDYLIFEGELDQYIDIKHFENDEYFTNISKRELATDVANHFIELSKRYFNK